MLWHFARPCYVAPDMWLLSTISNWLLSSIFNLGLKNTQERSWDLSITLYSKTENRIRQANFFTLCHTFILSRLYWLVLGFLYTIFVQWSIFAPSYLIPPPTYTIPPPTHILSAQGILLSSNTMLLHDSHSHFQMVFSSCMYECMYLCIYYFLLSFLNAKRKGEQVKFVAPPKEMHLSFSIVLFLTNHDVINRKH